MTLHMNTYMMSCIEKTKWQRIKDQLPILMMVCWIHHRQFLGHSVFETVIIDHNYNYVLIHSYIYIQVYFCVSDTAVVGYIAVCVCVCYCVCFYNFYNFY